MAERAQSATRLVWRASRTLAGLVLLAAGCTADVADQITTFEGRTMGTSYTIRVVGVPSSQRADALNRDIEGILESVNRQMSTWRTDSELSRFNRGPVGVWHPLSADLLNVFELGLEMSRKTAGAFDITVGRLVNLWGFGPAPPRRSPPSDAEIEAARRQVGYRYLAIDRASGRAKKHRMIEIDVAGIAPGYAVDLIAARLQALGFTNYLVEVGGEIRSQGRKPDGQPWKIAIESPRDDRREAHRILPASGISLATSGDYRNYFAYQGRRYAHILDVTTGRPATHALASVTVVAQDTATADALATALMVMGPDKGHRFAEAHNVAAYFIVRQDDRFVERFSPAFDQYLDRQARH